MRDANTIGNEARKIGKLADDGAAPSANDCIQILSKLLEDLAANVEKLQDDVQKLRSRSGKSP